ncbi:MAG: ATP synthase F1 subunit gamma [Candidatus Omnitrophota bacterium]|nr:ATP synthase F1 subunit gamma [Candidatus Omnitrophota bacterium]
MTQAITGIKLRMRSVANIRKITRAMEMVSMSKLNRVRASLFAMRNYFGRLEAIFNDFLAHTGYTAHPLFEKRQNVEKIGLCVITSDTGLCSTYNQLIIRAAEAFISRFQKENIKIVTVGKEGYHHFKKLGFDIKSSYPELHGRYPGKLTEKMASDLISLFLNREADEVYVAYTHFESTLRHRPKVEKFVNIEYKDIGYEDYLILEPDINGVAQELVPKYLSEKFRLTLLEALTSEHAARMFAMKTATDNANELMDTLTLLRNKARQAAITKEVIEIASGAEAMRE